MNNKKKTPKKSKASNANTNKPKRFQAHFRKFRNASLTGHPQYVYGEDGKDYVVIGITSTAETNGVKNIALDNNPQPGNKKQSYIRPQTSRVSKGVRNTKLKGWKFSAADKSKVNTIINQKKKPHK